MLCRQPATQLDTTCLHRYRRRSKQLLVHAVKPFVVSTEILTGLFKQLFHLSFYKLESRCLCWRIQKHTKKWCLFVGRANWVTGCRCSFSNDFCEYYCHGGTNDTTNISSLALLMNNLYSKTNTKSKSISELVVSVPQTNKQNQPTVKLVQWPLTLKSLGHVTCKVPRILAAFLPTVVAPPSRSQTTSCRDYGKLNDRRLLVVSGVWVGMQLD